jgi:hypothetical protein
MIGTANPMIPNPLLLITLVREVSRMWQVYAYSIVQQSPQMNHSKISEVILYFLITLSKTVAIS